MNIRRDERGSDENVKKLDVSKPRFEDLSHVCSPFENIHTDPFSGSEEETSPDHYYARDTYDDGYSPSPPRASGGAYYPDPHNHAAAPGAAPAGFTQHPNLSTPYVNEYPQQAYTAPGYEAHPADYQAHPADYQAHPADYPAHPADYQAHPPEYPANPAAYPTPNPAPAAGPAPGAAVPPPHDPYNYPSTRGPNPGENVSVEKPTVSSSVPQASSSQSPHNMYHTADEEGASR